MNMLFSTNKLCKKEFSYQRNKYTREKLGAVSQTALSRGNKKKGCDRTAWWPPRVGWSSRSWEYRIDERDSNTIGYEEKGRIRGSGKTERNGFHSNDPSTGWAGPVCSMNRRVNRTGVEYMGRPIYSTAPRAAGTGPFTSHANNRNGSRSIFDSTCSALVQMKELTEIGWASAWAIWNMIIENWTEILAM